MYIASLGSPERNAHLHVHVCPCPRGTPFDQQQFAAMRHRGARHVIAPLDRQRAIAERIRARLSPSPENGPTQTRLSADASLSAERMLTEGWNGISNAYLDDG